MQRAKTFNILEYFCKSHNVLCCAACISKIKGKGNGQHSECNICFIEDIKDEKKNKFEKNMKILEELSNTFMKSIDNLKIVLEKIKENRDELKSNIQNIFTKFRNCLNNREDELLLEVDKIFEDKFFKEDIIKQSEKLPIKVKKYLDKGKGDLINNDWENNEKLNSLINDCIDIENNIENINNIHSKIKLCNSDKINIKFFPKEDEINNFLNSIKFFGKIYCNSYKFKKCPINIDEKRKYEVRDDNILTKTGPEGYMLAICENELDKTKVNKWKIKILNSKDKYIDVGVAPIDFYINSATENNSGWYFACDNSKLYSGPPHNYSGVNSNLSKIKNEIIVVMDMIKGTLKFIVDNNEEKGESYTNIPLNKPLTPAVLLKDTNDSVAIYEC